MKPRTNALLPRALSRFRFPVLALQWGDNLVLIILAVLWLQIPDSHVWQFALSMISAVALVAGFCWIQIATFARIRPATERTNIWLRLFGFALVATLWFLLVLWIGSGSDSIPSYAYLWNSKLSPGMRITLAPARIIASLNVVIDVIICAITALLLPVAIVLSTDGLLRPTWRDARRPYRRILYWIAVFVFCTVVTQLTAALASWVPGRGVSGEVLSVALRLALAWTTDVLLWCLLLAFTGAWMEPAPAPLPFPKPAS
ncbi:MAG TPA: hypothetical protein VHE33_18515 [Acidobacteriaceae bacterium]|nr:hypothetical protein [Acidobacteriaceae bacterium]